MKVDLNTGLLRHARFVCSPNCNERPDNTDIDLIVLHNISLPPAQFGGPEIEAFFTNTLDHNQHSYFKEIAGMEVSSHLLIRRDGELIQFVPFHQRAWHAGVSCFGDQENCNDFSIGIELEGSDHIPYADKQYEQLSSVTRALMAAYPGITRDRVTGHSDIAPGRKTDPGPAFDWERLHGLL